MRVRARFWACLSIDGAYLRQMHAAYVECCLFQKYVNFIFIILGILAISILASIIFPQKEVTTPSSKTEDKRNIKNVS